MSRKERIEYYTKNLEKVKGFWGSNSLRGPDYIAHAQELLDNTIMEDAKINNIFHFHMDRFIRLLNQYIEVKNSDILNEFIFINELRNRAIQDEAFMDTMIVWFREGSTLRLRDELLKKIDGLFNFHNLDDFNSFCTIDTVGLYYRQPETYKFD